MENIKTVYKTVKEYLFPVFCLSCDAEGKWVCDSCMQYVQVNIQQFCPRCHKKTERGEACNACHTSSTLLQHIAVLPYEEAALIGKLIHVFKYQYAEEVRQVIDTIIVDFVSQHPNIFAHIDSIIPIPLHKKRFAERGFNQATYIANALSQVLHIPSQGGALVRLRNTPHQARLDRAERMKNVTNAFYVKEPADIGGMHIVLVDDVYTTGATMQSAAHMLLDAGAASVSGCTLARG